MTNKWIKFGTYFYVLLVLFATIGGGVTLCVNGVLQFGISVLLLGVVLGLGFFGVLRIPDKEDAGL